MTKVTQNINYLIHLISYVYWALLIVDIEENQQSIISFNAKCTQISALINIVCLIMQAAITIIDIDPEYKMHNTIQFLSEYK